MRIPIERNTVIPTFAAVLLVLSAGWIIHDIYRQPETLESVMFQARQGRNALSEARSALWRAELADQSLRSGADSGGIMLRASAMSDLDRRYADVVHVVNDMNRRAGASANGSLLKADSLALAGSDIQAISRLLDARDADISDSVVLASKQLEARNSRFRLSAIAAAVCGVLAVLFALTIKLPKRAVSCDERPKRKERDEEIESRGNLADVLETLPSAFLSVDRAGRISFANGQAIRLLKKDRASILGHTLREALPQAISDDFCSRCENVVLHGREERFDSFDPIADAWFSAAISPSPFGVSVYIRDVTTSKRALETQERLLALLEATPDVVGINDGRGVCYFNRAGRELFGLDTETTSSGEGGTIASNGLTDGESEQDVVRDLLQEQVFPIGLERGVWRAEKTISAHDGSKIPVSQVAIAHRDERGSVAFVSTILRDISERKRTELALQEQVRLVEQYSRELEEANLRLQALATTDGLTGLQNHRAFQEKLADQFQRIGRYGGSLSMLLLDVDTFKQYNDTFGHPAGDVVLRQVASLLQRTARTTDVVARYGGEEFVVILPETTADGAIELAERIRKAVESFNWDRQLVTVSIGAATYGPRSESPASLVEEADRALYDSKRLGRNRSTHADADLLSELGHVTEELLKPAA